MQCSNWHWMPEVEGQCAAHFALAYCCFFGFVGYIIHQTFWIDPQLMESLPHYTVPLSKKVLTVLPLISLAFMIVGVWRPDLFEIAMILFALVWMCTLRGTFDDANGVPMSVVIQFAEQSPAEVDGPRRDRLVV